MVACLLASGLIAKCFGYLPARNSEVEVKRACVFSFKKNIRKAAKTCAADNSITWRYK